jgi:hypothetical protein
MTKNLYFRTVHSRDNVAKVLFLGLFRLIASYPRLFLEVFTRKHFGSRYFRLSSALTVAAILGIYPVLMIIMRDSAGYRYMLLMHSGNFDESKTHMMLGYVTWYIFLVLFIRRSFEHHKDKKRIANEYDFEYYSIFSGIINPVFFEIRLPNGKTADRRQVECYFEPAFFLIIGLVLYVVGQKLGGLLIICSLFYSMNYIGDYLRGDNYVLDLIDEMIANRNLEKVFIDDVDPEDADGFEMRVRKPASASMRRKIVSLMTEDEEILEAT